MNLKPVQTFFYLVTLFSSCRNTYEQLGSSEISKGLYLERYKAYDAGVWGELTECYITDSLSFRTKIGSFDEHDCRPWRLEQSTIAAAHAEHGRSVDKATS